MRDLARMSESVDFAISKARSRLGVDKKAINKIEKEILDFMIDKKLELETLTKEKAK